jgi:pilus assembly protein TadC
MIERMQNALLCLGLALSVAWWTWSFLLWRRERALSRRLEKILDVPGQQRRDATTWSRRIFKNIRRRFQSSAWKRDLPDFFELLALAQSAGMSLPNAWAFAARSMGDATALTGVLNNVEALLLMGQSWEQALAAFAAGVDDERCAWIVGLMRQTLRRGSPLSDMLIDQVEQWRYAEAMNAERHAQTLSLKLLLPIFLFLLPAVFVVLFAPLLLRFSGGIPIF